jgi:hypothetical protein
MTARTNYSSTSVARASQFPPVSSLSRQAAGQWRVLPVSLVAVGGVALVVAALGWYAVWATPAPARITPAAYERIAAGMSRDEVQSAIGLPAGDYRNAAHQPGGRAYTEWSEEAGQEDLGDAETPGRLTWEGNAYSITVGFDEAGFVQWKTLWKHVPPTPRGPVEKVLAWLGR